MKKTKLMEGFPHMSWEEETTKGGKVVKMTFRWSVIPKFLDLGDYPELLTEHVRHNGHSPMPVIAEARIPISAEDMLDLRRMVFTFDIRPAANVLGLKLSGPGFVSFSGQENYAAFVSSMSSSMEAVASVERPKGKKGRRGSGDGVGEEMLEGLTTLARDFREALGLGKTDEEFVSEFVAMAARAAVTLNAKKNA